ncbi:uncharacterized protein LOC142814635 isoform X2 [Rhipicephalus microplus]|uniref:uncharacterized protein LOC142814635 isoform X2 n=1 Tax=Rhipicephalus microplus TaxID=6941 RepID=UPI003F6AE433
MMNSLFAMVIVDRPWMGRSSGNEQRIGAQATIEDQICCQGEMNYFCHKMYQPLGDAGHFGVEFHFLEPKTKDTIF